MELDKMIRDLHDERRQLDEAIRALEKLAAAGVVRRGRPPKWLSAIKAEENITGVKAARNGTKSSGAIHRSRSFKAAQ